MPYDPDNEFSTDSWVYSGDRDGQNDTRFSDYRNPMQRPNGGEVGHGPTPHTPVKSNGERGDIQQTQMQTPTLRSPSSAQNFLPRLPPLSSIIPSASTTPNGTPKPGRVEVAITPTVKKSTYLRVADDGEADELVTSDIGPKRKRAKHSVPAIDAPQTPLFAAQYASQLAAPLASSHDYESGRNTRLSSTTPIPLPSSAGEGGVGGTTGKKRGRPKGWKLGMGSYKNMTPGASSPSSTAGGGGGAKARQPGDEMKRRGRRPRPPSPGPRKLYESLANVVFTPFLCEWAGCPAQLHNFETLRKHVLVVHGRSTTCQWGRCADIAAAADAADANGVFADGQKKQRPRPPELDSDAAFQEHVDRAHLTPFVWHVGDGPRNRGPISRAVAAMRGDADLPPAYLFDERGVQVTPSVRGQMLENMEDRRLRLRRLKQLWVQRDRNAPEEPEYTEEELAELEAVRAARFGK